ncbi:hypothetical protein AJ80_06742 [Polytolypa hystricis UAMH7299]|uniref:Uncharacterized protein n=1 Tax=Polytolypa hystricis (strain UAMH7299) TaxID=1447883 RepID=A0A2B7XUM6_POLH7|nr:hypothetical protein AJ80_06742 [Polytolypa hystricis UAMH7299]
MAIMTPPASPTAPPKPDWQSIITSLIPTGRQAAAHSPSPPRPSPSFISKYRKLHTLLYLSALSFLTLILIGNTSDTPILRQFYFLKLDLSNIIPRSVPNAVLINSIARTIGLHDFYQVGLWNFCEGYNDDGQGITYCSKPKIFYFFNPVEILMNELLAGATIALPSEISRALSIARIVSNWIFALFLASALLIFLCLLFAPFSTPYLPPPDQIHEKPTPPPPTPQQQQQTAHKRTPFLPPLLLILKFLALLTTTAASTLSTAMFTVFKIVFTNNQADLNIKAHLGLYMLIFMWIAVGCVGVGFGVDESVEETFLDGI